MKTHAPLLLILLLSACGTLRETSGIADDVYDIPDRQAMAATAAAKQEQRSTQTPDSEQDYYSPEASRMANSADRDYYDMAYNDPYYYNYGRFGFGSGIGAFGPSYGMGLSYGWPTSFGSMSIGYGIGYGGGYGYDPYWGNSWMSGYGYDPYGYYGYGNYGYGYGGYGMGYGPYQGPLGGCYGCYEPVGYTNTVYGHRNSVASGGSVGNNAVATPRSMRNPAALLPEAAPARNFTPVQERNARPARSITPDRGREARPQSPARNWNSAPETPSRSGNDAGGGRTYSPRPR